METLFVKNERFEYPVYIKDSFEALEKAFFDAGFGAAKACIISDSNTEKLYLDDVKRIAQKCFSYVCDYAFEAGEKSKNLDVIRDFYAFFSNKGLDRKSVVIALGGGVTGDMAGFAAATYMRGIRFVQIPTTLLAQVDSSVGGKVGVDFMNNKNMVGAFYQPALVYINVKTLDTLPKEQFSAGMAEAIKYGYIIDSDFLGYINKNKQKIIELDSEAIKHIIYASCKAKAYVVSEDEKETGLREILNFGHTFGHAVESLSGFNLLHGECVAVGMMAALSLSCERKSVSRGDVEAARELLEFFELPVKVRGFDRKAVFEQMFSDKKTKNNMLNIVLLEKIGKAYTDKNAADDEVLGAIDFIL